MYAAVTAAAVRANARGAVNSEPECLVDSRS
jgi:hypothetical protein